MYVHNSITSYHPSLPHVNTGQGPNELGRWEDR